MFVYRPSTSAMLRALESLLGLGALDSEGALTPLGCQMVRLPVDPVFAKVSASSISAQHNLQPIPDDDCIISPGDNDLQAVPAQS